MEPTDSNARGGHPGRGTTDAGSDLATVAHPPPAGWPPVDPWAPVFAGIVALLGEHREQQAAASLEPSATAAGPELTILAEAVAELVVQCITSSDHARRARLRPILLALLAEVQTLDAEVAA